MRAFMQVALGMDRVAMEMYANDPAEMTEHGSDLLPSLSVCNH